MVSKTCIDLVKSFEGFRDKAYQCSAGKWTIGYGTTRYWGGLGVSEGDEIDEHRASFELSKRLDQDEKKIKELFKNTKLSENKLTALVSLVYNIGMSSFSRSTMATHINSGNFDYAADEFLKWKYVTDPKTKEKIESAGLLNRRLKERKLFLS